MSYRIINGDSAKELKKFKDNSIDAVITDPPYGIEFLAKDWDSNTGAVEIWQECLRVLKPGGFLLAFSAARTYHILATNIESVGFEIRDQIMWLYASGFPKAQDVGKAIQRRQGVKETKPSKGMNAYPNDVKLGPNRGVNPGNITAEDYPDKKADIIPTSPEAQKWAGWKTALKPAHEPICMARKPMKGSTIDNVLKHNVGALNIDESRIPFENKKDQFANSKSKIVKKPIEGYENDMGHKETHYIVNEEGRFPSNVIGEVEGYQKYFYKPKSDHEPICMARKPMKGSAIDNVLEHGVGALNIDATRIGTDEKIQTGAKKPTKLTFERFSPEDRTTKDLDRQKHDSDLAKWKQNNLGRFPSNVIGEVEGYQKFFYCPKVSRKERHRGFEQTGIPTNPSGMYEVDGTGVMYNPDKKDPLSHIKKGDNFGDGLATAGALHKDRDPLSHIPHPFRVPHGFDYRMPSKHNADPKALVKEVEARGIGNNHPTVKPVALMKYLIKLVAPQGSHILDPFCGSGSTGMAAKEMGYKFTGIEMDANYVDICIRRIEATKTDQFEKLFDKQ